MINFLTAALQRATELYDHGLKMWVVFPCIVLTPSEP